MPLRPPRIRRSPRGRGCHARTAAPPFRSYPLRSIDRRRTTDTPPAMFWPGAYDPLILLLAGIAIDALLGEMRLIFMVVPHPVVLAGRAIAYFDRKLNRPHRSERSRRERGIVTLIVLVGAAAALGALLHWLCSRNFLGAATEALVIGVLLSQRSLFQHVAAVAAALQWGGLPAGREAVRHIVDRDPASLDPPGVARAAIESLAE